MIDNGMSSDLKFIGAMLAVILLTAGIVLFATFVA